MNLVHPGCPSLVAMHDGSSKGGRGSFTWREGMPLSPSFLPRLCCLHPVLPLGPWILSTPLRKGAIRRGAGRGGDRSSTSVEPTTTLERPSTLNPPPGSGRGAPWGRAGGGGKGGGAQDAVRPWTWWWGPTLVHPRTPSTRVHVDTVARGPFRDKNETLQATLRFRSDRNALHGSRRVVKKGIRKGNRRRRHLRGQAVGPHVFAREGDANANAEG